MDTFPLETLNKEMLLSAAVVSPTFAVYTVTLKFLRLRRELLWKIAILMQHLKLTTQRLFPYHVETRGAHSLLAKTPVFRAIPTKPFIGYAAVSHLLNASRDAEKLRIPFNV